jgi:hypothetical protein
MVVLAVVGMVGVLPAAPPGTLDGQHIPTDFAAAPLVGLQTNRTGFGDVTSLAVVPTYSVGDELDALYLAKDANFLYVGLAGNLIEVGNDFIILIDSPFDFGQTELRTEGVGGPPFALQLAGREVMVNTSGTPADGTDDTYTVVPNSGTLLPSCGDPDFTGWDYALAVDGAGGNLYGHEYILFDVPIGSASAIEICNYADGRGRVACDPTPFNLSDPAMPIYALRNFVFESPIGDGNEVFEGGQPQFGYPRGGFDNANTSGVTETSAALAAQANRGIEVAIPLANIGAGLFGNETIHVFVVSMDADEYQETAVSEGFGTFFNQLLPPLGAGSASCDPPAGLGLRPDLSNAACLTVDLATLNAISPSAVLEGVIDPADYAGGAPKTVQTCPTSGGDQARVADVLRPEQPGSELDAMYATNDASFLYLGITGNLEGNGNSINVFFDVDPAAASGEHVVDFDASSPVWGRTTITTFDNFQLTGWYERWVTATFTSGPTSFRIQSTDFGGGFYDINPNLSAPDAVALELEITLNPANQADTLIVILVDEDITERAYRFDGLTNGHHVLTVPLSAYSHDNNPGSVPGLDVSNLSFFHFTGGFGHGNPGLPLDITLHNMALIDVVQGAGAVALLSGDELANGPLDVLGNGRLPSDEPVQYDVAYGINVSYDPYLASVGFFDLVQDVFTFRGAVQPDFGDAVLTAVPGGLVAENPNGLQLALNNWNTAGVISCSETEPCFEESAAVVADRARTANTGVEMAVPLADLGLTAADLPRIIHVWTLLGDATGGASDQSLPSMRNVSSAGNQVSVAGNAPVNFTDPLLPSTANAVLSDFGNFSLDGTYGVWTTAVFTAGPDSFRVESRDFGGGLHDIIPDVNAAGATNLELDVTLNPANQTDKIVVVLVDADGTERVYRFENLTNGSHNLSVPLSRYINDNQVGAVRGLDLANIAVFHIGGAFHHGNPGVIMDLTFDELRLTGKPRNFEARAARVCLGTIDGDADCDGDNDLVDIALLQQCIGVESDPLLPMECARLDFTRDGEVTAADMAGFDALLTGP